MSLTTQATSYNAKQLDSSKRKQLALDSMNESLSITDLANENDVSRKFRLSRISRGNKSGKARITAIDLRK